MVITKNITGKMVRDLSPVVMSANDYLDARNITVTKKAGKAQGVLGNRKISTFTLPAGACKVIGRKEDQTRKRLIYMVWNENGYHTILQHSFVTGETTKILQNLTDTGGADILGWTADRKMHSINLIFRPEDEGDLLYYTYPNQSPKGFILDKVASGAYGVVTAQIIEAAKRPPLLCPAVVYGDDSERNVNTLRRNLYQFQYRFVYDTYEKSTWSPFSDVALPVGVLDTDVDMDAKKNNYISVTVQTGSAQVTHIEIAVRENIAGAWSDTSLTASLSKADLGIVSDNTYLYRFYNDGLFPALDAKESILLFDSHPRKAEVMEVVNGNTLVYAGITEGYNLMPQNQLSVALSSANKINIASSSTGNDTGRPVLLMEKTNATTYRFTFSGYISAGMNVKVTAQVPVPLSPFQTQIIDLVDYTATGTENLSTMTLGLFNSVPPYYQGGYYISFFEVYLPETSVILSNVITGGISSPGTQIDSINSNGVWNWYSRYRFGLVYFDEQGRTNGVQNRVTANAGENMFEVETGGFQTDNGNAMTPIISAEINHTPPDWAVSFCWVRSKNLAFDKYFYYGTHDFQQDSDFYYFGMQNLQVYAERNTKFIYGNISSIVAEGDRMRVLSTYDLTAYGSNVWGDDYEIVGVEERTMTGITDKGMYIKVRKPATAPSVAYSAYMHVLIYSPAKNVSDESSEVYSEFGQHYNIITVNGNRYHQGGFQDQNATQPAKFTFIKGDVYFRRRTLYRSGTAAVLAKLRMIDASYSDVYRSSVTSNGRPMVRDVNAKEQYNPVLIRFGQTYFSGTNISGLNRFYAENYQEYDRSFGPIRRLRSRDRQLRVYQKYKCGAVPVYTQIIKDAAGSESILQSDRLLNDIQYYSGEFGIGDAPGSLASNNFADYFTDDVRGVVCRLSMDGLTPLSITEGMNDYVAEELPKRNGVSNIYGVFNTRDNQYISAMEAAGDSPADTLVFNEARNGFETFLDLYPDMMGCMNNWLYSFKDGELWVHDSETRCNFFGSQYKPTIKMPFVASPYTKKKFMTVSMMGSSAWDCPEIETSTGQESELTHRDFTKRDGLFHASLLRDKNSPKGITNGDRLEGGYITVRFTASTGKLLNEWDMGQVSFILSNLNNR